MAAHGAWTMPDADHLLLALQHGDSFFPSGAVSFSWGLETLAEEGKLTSAEAVTGFVAGQLEHRWAELDRAALVLAHRAGGDLEGVARVDRALEAQTLAAELRDGSRRTGIALLGVHEKLGTTGARDYRDRVRGEQAPGHGAAVQGLLWSAVGLSERAAVALSAHTLSVGLLGAALRLGLIGHLDAQRSLAELRLVIEPLIDAPPPALGKMRSFSPEAEIAAMRHETAGMRLFAN
jgi:urease accessory protein